MSPERLEEIRWWTDGIKYMEVVEITVRELIAEIDRLRAPVDDVEVAKCLISLTNACRCDGDTECTFCGTVTFITRLVRERDEAKQDAKEAVLLFGLSSAELKRLRASEVRAEAAAIKGGGEAMTDTSQKHEIVADGESTLKWAFRHGFMGTIRQLTDCARCGKYIKKRLDEPRHIRDALKPTMHFLCDQCFEAFQ